MRPLSVEQIKKLKPGDWIWVIERQYLDGMYYFVKDKDENGLSLISIEDNRHHRPLNLDEYEKFWIAYKNKESRCLHGVCCFPECENQDYCTEIAIEEGGIFNRGELEYYMGILEGFIKYIRPKEINGGVQEAIDGLEEFVKIYMDRVRKDDVR